MPNFTEVCRQIRAELESQGIQLSGRKIKHAAGQYLIDQARREAAEVIADELAEDGEIYNPLTYSDPTGRDAVSGWIDANLVRPILEAEAEAAS